MAIQKLSPQDDRIEQRRRQPAEPETDSEYDEDDIPELGEMDEDEIIYRPNNAIQRPRRYATDRTSDMSEQDQMTGSITLNDDIVAMFRQSFYDPLFDLGAVPQPDNVIRTITTPDGDIGHLIRYNGNTVTIDGLGRTTDHRHGDYHLREGGGQRMPRTNQHKQE